MNATQNPGQEEQKSALEQFGINLTELARQGKLDPVSGRDSEIRRVSQVLTRRRGPRAAQCRWRRGLKPRGQRPDQPRHLGTRCRRDVSRAV
mgnify:CR=1 FL=1